MAVSAINESANCTVDDLTTAAASGNIQHVLILLEAGVNVNGKNKFGRTAIQVMRHNLPEIAETLLKAGANLNIRDEGLVDGTATLRTICHDVAASGYINTLRCLLRYGGDITVVDKWKNTPAHIAAKCGHVKMVQYLSLGVRLDMRNADGLTPLDYLCTLEDAACKQWLDYITGNCMDLQTIAVIALRRSIGTERLHRIRSDDIFSGRLGDLILLQLEYT